MPASSQTEAAASMPREIGVPTAQPRNRAVRRHIERSTWLLCAAFVLFAVLMLSRALSYWAFTLDDAYITLRYARHLAQGLGPSWNPGASPAEGYTTASWMLILSVAELVRLDGPRFAKGAGVAFALASFATSAWLLRRATRAARLGERAEMLAITALVALFACYWPLSLHAVSGMETTLSCCVLTAFFLQSTTLDCLTPPAHAEPVCRRLAQCALACCLTRPEAVLPCAVTLLAHFASSPERRAAMLRACTLWLFIPFAVYYGLRWYYFDLLFPLSFYVKAAGQPLFTGLPDVLDFFAPVVIEQPWWGLLFVFGAVRARSIRKSLLGALSLTIFFIFPEHIMAFEGRYLLPVFPLLAATAALGAAYAFQGISDRLGRRARLASAGIAPLVLAVFAALPLPPHRASRAQRWLDYGHNLRAAHVALAHDLAGAKSLGGRIALLDVGAVGYYADWYTIDTFGLNDAHVALTRRTDVGYVFAQRPDLLVVVSAEPGHFKEVFAWETPLYEAARQHDYQRLCDYEFEPDYYLQVLGRPDAEAVRGDICASAVSISSR
jgi:arabinofuranosyltransferase